MHLHLSAVIAGDLHVTTFATPESSVFSAPGVWFAHRVTCQRHKCVILMEEHSRYATVFCGWKQKEFQKFQAHFAERLWREALVSLHLQELQAERFPVCLSLRKQQEAAFSKPEAVQQALRQKAHALCAEFIYHKNLTRSIQAHIKDAAMQLDVFANFHLGHLPETPEEEMLAAAYINQAPRCTSGNWKDAFFPPERFRAFWQE